MKLALDGVKTIHLNPINDMASAAEYIQVMYDDAYGQRAGRVDLRYLTPNEERLIEALCSRNAGRFTANAREPIHWNLPESNPMVVHCGDKTYCFVRAVHPVYGFIWPFPLNSGGENPT